MSRKNCINNVIKNKSHLNLDIFISLIESKKLRPDFWTKFEADFDSDF